MVKETGKAHLIRKKSTSNFCVKFQPVVLEQGSIPALATGMSWLNSPAANALLKALKTTAQT